MKNGFTLMRYRRDPETLAFKRGENEGIYEVDPAKEFNTLAKRSLTKSPDNDYRSKMVTLIDNFFE